MATTTRIHTDKTPPRTHYIVEWAERRGKKQADIVRGTGADKGLVSRWFDGVIPSEKYLQPLAEFLQAGDPPEPAALFRHPDDDWLARLFRDRSDEERERMIRVIETAFPIRRAS